MDCDYLHSCLASVYTGNSEISTLELEASSPLCLYGFQSLCYSKDFITCQWWMSSQFIIRDRWVWWWNKRAYTTQSPARDIVERQLSVDISCGKQNRDKVTVRDIYC